MNILAIDVETNSLNYWETELVSWAVTFGTIDTENAVFDCGLVEHPESTYTVRESIAALQSWINKSDLIIGANFKFDYEILTRYGIDFKNKPLYDILYIEYLYSMQTEKWCSLENLAQKYLKKSKDDIDFSIMRADEYPAKELLNYNVKDTQLTFEIFKSHYCDDKFGDYEHLIRLHSGLIKLLAEIELNGCAVDADKLQQYKEEYEGIIKGYEDRINELFEFPININSGSQLRAALFGGSFTDDGVEEVQRTLKSGAVKTYTRKCKVDKHMQGLGFKPTLTTPSGESSTSEDAVKMLKCRTKKQKAFKERYVKYKKAVTVYDKYLSKYHAHINNGKLYTHYNTTATATGRLSSSKPNIQQIPRNTDSINLRDLFISRFDGGYILELDFKQLEWRIAATLCGDDTMIEEIISNKDAHKENASLAFNIPVEEVTSEQRQVAKTVSFGLIYGQTAYGMANYRPDIPVDDEREAQLIIDKVYTKYPGLAKWHSSLIARANNYKQLSVPSGRTFYFPFPDAVTNIKNYPVQGFSFDVAYFLFAVLADQLKKYISTEDYAICNTVHDCLVFDCRNYTTVEKITNFSLDFISSKSYNYIYKFFGYDLKVPLQLEAEYGHTWGSLQEIV